MSYCHKHGQGLATGRCDKCDDELIALGIQADKDKIKRQTETPYADLSFDEKESDRKEADKFLLALSIENKKDGFAYSQALAFESLELREKFDQDKKEFNGVTFDDIERYAKIVAYKVANNLKNGFVMDNNDDPLNYGNE